MGIRELRDSFNFIAAPAATCTHASMTYERPDGKEMTFLTFSGIFADGVPFQIKSDGIPSNRAYLDLRNLPIDVAARETAQRLLEQKR